MSLTREQIEAQAMALLEMADNLAAHSASMPVKKMEEADGVLDASVMVRDKGNELRSQAAALASLNPQAAEGEPAAWMVRDKGGKECPVKHVEDISEGDVQEYELTFYPLYTHPTPEVPSEVMEALRDARLHAKTAADHLVHGLSVNSVPHGETVDTAVTHADIAVNKLDSLLSKYAPKKEGGK